MIDKKEKRLAAGIAFVAFSTQFGFGFASGKQLIQFFVDYGAWALIMPLLSQGLLAFFLWYGLRYAYANKTFDYRSFSDKFYGNFSVVFSNIYEAVYLVLAISATSVGLAMGCTTIENLVGIPYCASAAIIGMLIVIIAAYGTDVVRKCAFVFSVLIIIILLVVVVPNIIVKCSTITDNVSYMIGGKMPVSSIHTGALAPALGKAVLYFLYQLLFVGFMYQYIRPCKNEKEIDRAAIYAFVLNTVVTILIVTAMCAVVYSKGLIDAETSKLIDIPMILFVEEGIGTDILKPVVFILIVLGTVSTGVNIISGIVTRCANQICKNENSNKRKLCNLVFAVIFTIFACGVAHSDVGIIIKIGYKWVGWFSCVVVGIPYIIHMFTHIGKKNF